MSNEIKGILNMVLGKLDKMDGKMDRIESRMDRMENRLDNMDGRMDRMESRLDKIESRMDTMEARQDEMFGLVRGLEENIIVTRAKQERMEYVLADVHGKINKLTDSVEDHDNVIRQIKSIK